MTFFCFCMCFARACTPRAAAKGLRLADVSSWGRREEGGSPYAERVSGLCGRGARFRDVLWVYSEGGADCGRGWGGTRKHAFVAMVRDRAYGSRKADFIGGRINTSSRYPFGVFIAVTVRR
jgi:hypothetical protein